MADAKLQDKAQYRWDLSIFYDGLDDPRFSEDKEKADALLAEASELIQKLNAGEAEEDLLEAVAFLEKATVLAGRLGSFLSLSMSTDSTNSAYQAELNQLMMKFSVFGVLTAAVTERVKALDDLDAFIERNGLEDYCFMLHETKEKAVHVLSQELESMIAKLQVSGGSAWENLSEYLTSTLEVDWEGGKVTLSDIRNLASDPDPDVRKRAYEAELKAYEKIEVPMAFALNSIKSQVNLLAKERGFGSALDQALEDSRLSRESLEAMLSVMEAYQPQFRRYFAHKAMLLGKGEKLPFYDLFAPIGKLTKKYTVEEGQELLLETFEKLSPEIAALMKRAFEERWIDYLPRPGKRGGAFCHNLPEYKQSRVLSNYDGSFGAVDTLAHELGHAYHGLCIEKHRPLNRGYTMPVAETASTFNETHLTLSMLARSDDEDERLTLLEEFISGAAQTIIDIRSRFLFEKEVFERVDREFLSSEALQDIMLRAQEATYGEGLDENFRHPYMWVCKPHYYSASLSYYNFPYAFGQLFAMGLYSMFREEGESFMPKYRALLEKTTVASCEDVAAEVGIDIRKEDFWKQGMESFGLLIDEYCALVRQRVN